MPAYRNHQPFYHRVNGMKFQSRREINHRILERNLESFLRRYRPSELGIVNGSVQLEEFEYEGAHEDIDEQVRHYYRITLLFTSVTGFGEVRFMAAMRMFIESVQGTEFCIIPEALVIPPGAYEEPDPGDPSDL